MYAKYVSRAGERMLSCIQASHGVSQRTMGMRRWRRALRHLGRRRASVQRSALVLLSCTQLHAQWSWCRFPASRRFSFSVSVCMFFCAGADIAAALGGDARLTGASCWGHMRAVGGRLARGRQHDHGQQAGWMRRPAVVTCNAQEADEKRPGLVAGRRSVGRSARAGCPGEMRATKIINTPDPLATIYHTAAPSTRVRHRLHCYCPSHSSDYRTLAP